MTEQSVRRLDCQRSRADNHAWALIGLPLRDQAVEVLGYNQVVDVEPIQVVIDTLMAAGHRNLAVRIVSSISHHNEHGVVQARSF